MESPEKIDIKIDQGVGEICFSSAKANSLSKQTLARIAGAISELDADSKARVIFLRSAGEGAFCAGASFEEFKKITTAEESVDYFMGFARIILAVRRAGKFVVVRVQGKAVGGALGLAAGADYALASSAAAGRLSEFELGIGPFTIGPAVERKIGAAAFSAMSIDCAWRDAGWLESRGLYAGTFSDLPALDKACAELLTRLAAADVAATKQLKAALWEGTAHWGTLLPERAAISGRLLMGQQQLRGPA